jgi:hypothetical protein
VKVITNPRTKIWSAAASVARRRFGLRLANKQAATNPKRRRRFALPAYSKNLNLKSKIPSPSCLTKTTGSDGIFSEEEFPVRPEHLFAGVQMLQQRSGRSPGFDRH